MDSQGDAPRYARSDQSPSRNRLVCKGSNLISERSPCPKRFINAHPKATTDSNRLNPTPKLADPQGFEPRQRESKSLVLPLHQGSILSSTRFSRARLPAEQRQCRSHRLLFYDQLGFYSKQQMLLNGWLGTDRTCDMRINSALLLPLSY